MSGQPGHRDEPRERLRALATAMAHPFRSKLLFAVAERDEGVSIRQLSERLGERPRRIRYHLDALHERELVQIAQWRRQRGTIERFYRLEQPPCCTSAQLEGLGADQSRMMATQILRAVLEDARRGLRAEVFGVRPGHTVVRLPSDLDEKAWREIAKIQERTLSELQAAISDARVRLASSGEEPIPTLAALLLFEVPRWPSS